MSVLSSSCQDFILLPPLTESSSPSGSSLDLSLGFVTLPSTVREEEGQGAGQGAGRQEAAL